MVDAALISETLSGSVGSELKITGQPLKVAVYTATVVTTLDWVVLSDFTKVLYAKASVASTGADNVAIIDGTTTNKVTLTSTGASNILVIGY